MTDEKNTNGSRMNIKISGQGILDFFNFKIMLIGEIIKLLFIFGCLGIIYNGMQMMRYSGATGIIFIVAGILILRIVLEFFMVIFAILDTLRDIRDRLPEQK